VWLEVSSVLVDIFLLSSKLVSGLQGGRLRVAVNMTVSNCLCTRHHPISCIQLDPVAQPYNHCCTLIRLAWDSARNRVATVTRQTCWQAALLQTNTQADALVWLLDDTPALVAVRNTPAVGCGKDSTYKERTNKDSCSLPFLF